jgi:hypothetical protein
MFSGYANDSLESVMARLEKFEAAMATHFDNMEARWKEALHMIQTTP